MTCPMCGEKTTVVVTRKECDLICRRRRCLTCKHTFYTTEIESGSDDFYRLDKIASDASHQRQRERRARGELR